MDFAKQFLVVPIAFNPGRSSIKLGCWLQASITTGAMSANGELENFIRLFLFSGVCEEEATHSTKHCRWSQMTLSCTRCGTGSCVGFVAERRS